MTQNTPVPAYAPSNNPNRRRPFFIEVIGIGLAIIVLILIMLQSSAWQNKFLTTAERVTARITAIRYVTPGPKDGPFHYAVSYVFLYTDPLMPGREMNGSGRLSPDDGRSLEVGDDVQILVLPETGESRLINDMDFGSQPSNVLLLLLLIVLMLFTAWRWWVQRQATNTS